MWIFIYKYIEGRERERHTQSKCGKCELQKLDEEFMGALLYYSLKFYQNKK